MKITWEEYGIKKSASSIEDLLSPGPCYGGGELEFMREVAEADRKTLARLVEVLLRKGVLTTDELGHIANTRCKLEVEL